MKPEWVRVHPWLVRFTHWLNAIVLVVLIGSGLEIFAAFPGFGGKIPQHDLVQIPQAMRLGGWLGRALQWHFAFAWLFAGGGVAYAAYQLLSGHWRQTFFMPADAAGVWPVAKHYLRLAPAPAYSGEYNPLQKLAYTTTIACGALAILTGLALYKPVQFQTLTALAGGFGAMRLLHFLAMCGFLAFIPGHLLMVALHGWNNCRSMLTGWKETNLPHVLPSGPLSYEHEPQQDRGSGIRSGDIHRRPRKGSSAIEGRRGYQSDHPDNGAGRARRLRRHDDLSG